MCPILSAYLAITSLFKICQHCHEYLAGCRKIFLADANLLDSMGVHIECGLVKLADGILENNYSTKTENSSDIKANLEKIKAADRLIDVYFIKDADISQYIDISRYL